MDTHEKLIELIGVTEDVRYKLDGNITLIDMSEDDIAYLAELSMAEGVPLRFAEVEDIAE